MFIIRPIWAGLIVLAVLVSLTTGAGVYIATVSSHDIAIDFLEIATIYTSPYIIYGGAGFVMFHIKRVAVIAHTFNFGAAALLLTWLIVTLRGGAASQGEGLHAALADTFLFSAVIAGGFCFVLGCLAYLAPAKR
ncbi:MAG: hypothetical protein IDH49_03760 [Gammaproteobacteria bacterium]|nr:hypothetical protein [Gammaproteobacteria bacterium]